MCLSIPAKVLSVEGDMAEVSCGNAVFKAGIHLLDNVRAGEYVLLHAGFAIQKICEDDALATLKLLGEMEED
jgi:hydrogenase expression/formation protein HypC